MATIQIHRGPQALATVMFFHDQELQPFPADLSALTMLDWITPIHQNYWWCNPVLSTMDDSLNVESWVIDQVFPEAIRHRPVLAVGLGSGGWGALRFALKYPQCFSAGIAINAIVDAQDSFHQDMLLQQLYPHVDAVRMNSPTSLIHPDRLPGWLGFAVDPASGYWRGNDRLHEKLVALGVPHRYAVGRVESLWTVLRPLLQEAIDESQQAVRRLL